jgi:hypothetical protein
MQFLLRGAQWLALVSPATLSMAIVAIIQKDSPAVRGE